MGNITPLHKPAVLLSLAVRHLGWVREHGLITQRSGPRAQDPVQNGEENTETY